MKYLLLALLPLMFSNCGVDKVVNDVKETVALKDVVITSDAVRFEPLFPPIVPGKTFDDLRYGSDSAVYKDPANYGIKIIHTLNAENSGKNQAVFRGARIDIALKAHNSDTIDIENDGFTVPAMESVKSNSTGDINAAAERLACLYLFQQLASGDSIQGSSGGVAYYEIGTKSGEIPFTSMIPFSIPTTSTPERQAFFQGAIDAGIFGDE